MSATARISVVASKGANRYELKAEEMSAEELLKVASYFFHEGARKLKTERES